MSPDGVPAKRVASASPSTRAKVWFSICALLAGLAVAEILARSSTEERVTPPRVEGEVVVRSTDPDLRFENAPHREQCIVYRHPGSAAELRVVARVNEQGWRGRLVPLERRTGVARIATLGDSHTFGHGVGDDETWSAVLERQLSSAASPVEVMNCGVNGYDADQVFALLEKRVLPYAPDLVVYGFFCNDAAIAGTDRPSADPTDRGPDLEASAGAIGWLRAHSRFVDVVAKSLRRRSLRAQSAEKQARLYDEDSAGWRRLRAELVRVRERLAARDTRFVVVLVPLFVPVGSGLLSSVAHEKMSAFCNSAEIPCLDLEPLYRDLDLDDLRVHPLDLHAGVEAHRIAGLAVANWILDQRLLDERTLR